MATNETSLEEIQSKTKYNEMLIDIAEQEGIDVDTVNVISTVGYLMRLMSNTQDKYALSQALINRDKFVVTTNTMGALIKHARSVSLSYGFAQPARVHVQMSVNITDIATLGEEINLDMSRLTIRADDFNVLMGENYPFSILYDIHVEEYLFEGEYRYRATYDMSGNPNPMAPDENNPNIAITLYRQFGIDFVGLELIMYQYTVKEVESRYIDSVNSSFFDVDFEDQLGNFEIFYTDQLTKTEINVDKALFIDSDQSGATMFYELNEHNVRFINKYEAGNFYPTRNSIYKFRLYQTKGSEANFEGYTGDINTVILNDEMEVNLVYSARSSSVYGLDKLTEEEFREKIISYKSRRDAVVSVQDMINYYNENGDSDFSYKINKVIDNIFDRVFNNYILMRYENNIVPTNTLNVTMTTTNAIKKSGDDYWVFDNAKYIETNGYGTGVLVDKAGLDPAKHSYRSPFNLSYNVASNYVSVYDAVISRQYLSSYNYTDNLADLSYQVNYLNCEKKLDDDYRIFVNVTPTTDNAEDFMLEDDGSGGKQQSDNIIVRLFFRGADKNPLGYVDLNFTEHLDPYYRFEVNLTSDNYIYDKFLDVDMMIRDTNTGIYTQGILALNVDDTTFDVAFFNKEVGFTQPGTDYTIDDKLVPIITDYRLVNLFNNVDIRLFTDRTALMPFQVTNVIHEQATGDLQSVDFVNVVLIKDDFFAEHQIGLSAKINTEIDLINNLSEFLESNEKLRINFVNSYGLAKAFKIGYNNETLDSTDIALNFTCKMYDSTTVSEEDVKNAIVTFIKGIDFLSGETFQIYDLIAYIKETYTDDIEIFQFNSINAYDSGYQYIYGSYSEFDLTIPEVLSVGLNSEFEYDINFSQPNSI